MNVVKFIVLILLLIGFFYCSPSTMTDESLSPDAAKTGVGTKVGSPKENPPTVNLIFAAKTEIENGEGKDPYEIICRKTISEKIKNPDVKNCSLTLGGLELQVVAALFMDCEDPAKNHVPCKPIPGYTLAGQEFIYQAEEGDLTTLNITTDKKEWPHAIPEVTLGHVGGINLIISSMGATMPHVGMTKYLLEKNMSVCLAETKDMSVNDKELYCHDDDIDKFDFVIDLDNDGNYGNIERGSLTPDSAVETEDGIPSRFKYNPEALKLHTHFDAKNQIDRSKVVNQVIFAMTSYIIPFEKVITITDDMTINITFDIRHKARWLNNLRSPEVGFDPNEEYNPYFDGPLRLHVPEAIAL